ncbi:MAG TPA: VOC family protein [Chitinophagaceae bacterium]|jgi:predicted 3-demethylubiquinone-9 3-methyltransferase (glyoxalase superfamily)
MQKITPFLWFDDQAEDAVKFYASVFKNSKIGNMARYDDASAAAAGRPKGSLMTASFELDGQDFIALNGGPHFKFTEAISFVVNCDTQKEIDYYWEKLTEGGEESQCGWLKDKFGLSWQIVPSSLGQLIGGPDKEKSQRAMGALMKMRKLVIADLENA